MMSIHGSKWQRRSDSRILEEGSKVPECENGCQLLGNRAQEPECEDANQLWHLDMICSTLVDKTHVLGLYRITNTMNRKGLLSSKDQTSRHYNAWLQNILHCWGN